MKYFFLSLIISLLLTGNIYSKPVYDGTFKWGRVTYINLRLGEKYKFEGKEIELIQLKNHYNQISVDGDTVWLKVSRRSPVSIIGNLKIFVADNRNVKAISSDKEIHGLLIKDAMVAVCSASEPMVDAWTFSFPVSFSDGYLWRNNEDSYMFSYLGAGIAKPGSYPSFAGAGIDMVNARAMEKHMIVAMESGRVVWVENQIPGTPQPKASVCVESESSPGIYYIYNNLHNRFVFVRKNQKVVRGESLGYIWGDNTLENLHFTIVKNDSVPRLNNFGKNTINFFPQLMELYYGKQPFTGHLFSKGQILFGKPAGKTGNVKNAAAFEEYQGTGWKLDAWNSADKVEWVSTKQNGNVRLLKTLFKGQPAQCVNPENWYDYEINVRNGVYRIRAFAGDCFLPSWQKIEFEGVVAGTIKLSAGEFAWTNEKIVKVKDGKLTTRIYLGEYEQVAGLASIVFQQVNEN